jgi:hypothetical protein
MKPLRYLVTAAFLGAGWFVVLLIPTWTRQWLLEDRGSIVGHVAALALASMLVAWIFRHYIGGADGLGQNLKRALLLPYVGCLIYLALWNALTLARAVAHGWSPEVHDMLVLFPWGLGSALAAFFVVIPYGLLCQVLMKAAYVD